MPIYEYQCDACGHRLEKLQRISDGPLKDCPSCGEASLRRLVSAAAFRLKGGGWYETDFKKGDKKNLHDSGTSKTGSGSDGKQAVKDGKAAEKKPAAAKAETSSSTAGSSAS